MSHPEGYIEPDGAGGYDYVYQYKDHLGNIRLSYSDSNGNSAVESSEIIEESNYYPFGLKHRGYNSVVNGVPNKFFTYNGVELEKSLDLNMYEMDFRQYDPAMARWIVIDPVTHWDMSPYNAFDNNPVYWADPSGADATSFINDLWNKTPNDGLSHHYNNQGEETGTSDPSESNNDQTSENNSNNGNESCCKNWWQRVKNWFRKKIDQSSGWAEANTDLLDERHEKILYIEGADGYTYAVFENGEIYRIKFDRWERVDSVTLPAPPTVKEINIGKSIYSMVKNSPRLLKYARILGKNKSWSAQINNLLNQLSKGNFNPGTGTKHLFNGVSELRSLGGARVYFRNTSKGIEILGYSNKANQQAVIKILRQLYGK